MNNTVAICLFFVVLNVLISFLFVAFGHKHSIPNLLGAVLFLIFALVFYVLHPR